MPSLRNQFAGSTSNPGNDHLDEFGGRHLIQLIQTCRSEIVRPDDVDQVPSGERVKLLSQQAFALSIHGERVQDAFVRRVPVDVGRGFRIRGVPRDLARAG